MERYFSRSPDLTIDLTELPGFVPAAGRAMARIRADGMAAALEACGKEALK